jgi:hypothetical protein
LTRYDPTPNGGAEFGVPRLLGTVRNNERKTFVVRESVQGGAYRLLALRRLRRRVSAR